MLFRSQPLASTLDTRAVTALASYLAGETEDAVNELEELLTELGEGGLEEGDEGRLVRGVIGTVWILEGEDRREEGVEILREAVELGKDQEWSVIPVCGAAMNPHADRADTHSLGVLSHLYLSLSVASHSHTLLHSPGTTSWTADSLLSQILAARTNLSLGPTAKYQEAYYVYEEVKGMQGGRGETTLAGIAVSQALMGRWEESVQASEEALEMVRPWVNRILAIADHQRAHRTQHIPPRSQTASRSRSTAASPQQSPRPPLRASQTALALSLPALTCCARPRKLQEADPSHPMVLDLAAKESVFDDAASKFSVSIAA